MKKVILLFLLILPVVIVSFAFLMASVIRTAIYPVIESVYVADKDWDAFIKEYTATGIDKRLAEINELVGGKK